MRWLERSSSRPGQIWLRWLGCCITCHASSSGNSAGSEHMMSRGAAGAQRGRFLGRPATSPGTGGAVVGGSTGTCKVGSEASASDSIVCDARATSASMLCGCVSCTVRFLLLGMLPKAAEPGCSGGASGGGGNGGNGSAGVAVSSGCARALPSGCFG